MYISVYLLSCFDIRVELDGILYTKIGPYSASNTNLLTVLVATHLQDAHSKMKLYHLHVYKCLHA